MRRHDNERGAVAIVVGITMSLLVIMSAFVVDLGMQRAARRDMQSVADIVSLDLARLLDARTATEIVAGGSGVSSLSVALQNSVNRNNVSALGTPSTSTCPSGATCYKGVSAYLVAFTNGTYATTGSGLPVAVSGSTVPDAVVVVAQSDVAFALGGLTGVKGGGVSRSAVALATESACIKLGSSLLDLQSGNSTLLGPLLGDALGVSALSYNGLVGTQLQLGDLGVALGAGTTNELLASEVTIGQFYAAILTAVANDGNPSNNGVSNVLTASLLQAINAQAGLDKVKVGDLIGLQEGDNAALESSINILELVTGAAYIANGENALAIPGLSIPIAGLSASLFLTEPPKQACRKGKAETAQLKVQLKQTLPVLGILGPVASVALTVDLELARASGGVAAINCLNGQPQSVTVRLDEQTIVKLTLKLDVTLLGGLIPVTSANIPGTVPAAGSAGSYVIPDPAANPPKTLADYYNQPFQTPGGTGSLGLANVSSAQLSLLGINLGIVGSLIVPVINAALTPIVSLLNNTISPLLGLRLGNADIFIEPTPTCVDPSLVG